MKKIDRVLLAHNVESIAAYDFDPKKVFGAAYAVVQNNELIYQKCFGHTSSDCSAPVTTRTLFRMASMTKPISAFATLILVDRGMLSLDDAVEIVIATNCAYRRRDRMSCLLPLPPTGLLGPVRLA